MTPFKTIAEHVFNRLEKELSGKLTYHCIDHTRYVIKIATEIGVYEDVSPHNLLLLQTAALYHDVGFVKVYKGHEEVSCEIAREELERFDYDKEDIDLICGMIMATRIPQSPKNHLEEILADADLEYLGTDLFESIGNTLFKELKFINPEFTIEQWNDIQINFMQQHHYFTDFCKKERGPKKQDNLNKLIENKKG